MPRLVVPKSKKGRLASETLEDTPKDKYKDRLVKYIPAESVALYAFVDKLLISYYEIDFKGNVPDGNIDSLLHIFPWLFLIIGIIGTPIYLYKQKLKNQPWRLHAILSTIAFVLWAYTLGGSIFILNGYYHVLAAGIAAPFFTYIAGWFEPKPQ